MRRFVIFLLCAAILAGFAGYWFGNRETGRLRLENQKLTSTIRVLRHQPKQSPSEAALFFMQSTATAFRLKPILYLLPGKRDRHIEALEALFAGPPAGSKLLAVFPKETKVLGFSLRKGLAEVNLNQKASQINVGAQGEALAIAAIVNTLTKFPDVYRVVILIDGKETESLAGHVDLTQEFEYNTQVVENRL